MCPKYPNAGARNDLMENKFPTLLNVKLFDCFRYGPSPTNPYNKNAPTIATAEITMKYKVGWRNSGNNFIACGNAVPITSAPTKLPSHFPKPSLFQSAAIFI